MRPLDPRLLPMLRPAAPALAGLVAAGVLSSVLMVAQTFAVAHLLVVVVRGRIDELPLAAGLLLGAVVARALAGLAGDTCAASASASVSHRLRRRLVGAMLAPAGGLSQQRGGELSLLVTRGVSAVDPYLTRYLPALVLGLLLPPLTLVAIATQDLLAAAIVAVTLPLVPVFAILVGMATRDRAESQWRLLTSLAGHFVDVVRGLPTLVVHGRARAQSTRIRRVTDEHRRATLATLRIAFASSAVLELVATLSVALVAVVVGLRLAAGSLDLDTALVVLLLAPEAYWPLRRMGAEFHAAAEGTASLSAAQDVFDAVPVEPSRLAETPALAGVRLDDVRVTYPGRHTPALDLPGRHQLPVQSLVAVTGPSGCGKSTLLAALAGEVPLDSGRIGAGPASLDERHLPGWREQVSWVPQRPWLQSGSVREELLLAAPGADDDAVWAALSQVGLQPLVADLPDGLDSRTGEDASRLSAGQRARLSLARAVLADRALVLVDEPSAHLDLDSERVIVQALRRLACRSTVVVVTHSEQVLAAADRIVRLTSPESADPTPCSASAAEHSTGAAVPVTVASVTAKTIDATSPGVRRWLLAVLLGILASISGVALTVTSGWLITRASEHPPVLYLTVAIVGVRAFGIGRPLLRYAERLVGHDGALRMLAERRVAVYDSVVPLTPGALGRRRGDVLSSVVDDVDALLDDRLRVRGPMLSLVGVSAMSAVIGGVLMPGAAAVVAVLALVTMLVAILARSSVARVESDLVHLRARLSDQVLHVSQGARDLVLWQATERAVGRVDLTARSLGTAARRSASRVAVARCAVTAAVGAATAGAASMAGSEVAAGRLAAPTAAALVLLPLALGEVLLTAPDAAATSVRTRAAKARLAGLAATEAMVSEPPHPRSVPACPLPVDARGLTGGWDGAALLDLELHVVPGGRWGVVGPSGSGKSTLAAMLVRFLDPTAGAVSLGDADLRDLALDDVHRLVGLVDDDPHVFSSSVLENVRLARPGASREQVERVLREVSLGPWLDELPGGLDTLVGEGHDSVSGGERARLGLARALLADHPVLVLDEPTAHLDASTAEAVSRDVLRCTRGRSLVWVTHDAVALDAMDGVLDLAAPRSDRQAGDTAAPVERSRFVH